MATLTRDVTIDAPVKKVFDYLLDLNRMWACWPDVAVRDVERTRDGVGSTARMYGHFVDLHIEGVVSYTEVVKNERVVARVDFGPEHPTWAFTVAPADDGTILTAEGEWHVNVPGIGRQIEGLIAREHEDSLQRLLANIKAQVEARVPAQAKG